MIFSDRYFSSNTSPMMMRLVNSDLELIENGIMIPHHRHDSLMLDNNNLSFNKLANLTPKSSFDSDILITPIKTNIRINKHLYSSVQTSSVEEEDDHHEHDNSVSLNYIDDDIEGSICSEIVRIEESVGERYKDGDNKFGTGAAGAGPGDGRPKLTKIANLVSVSFNLISLISLIFFS